MALRDIALTLLLISALPISLARPYVGALFFAWVSLMNPHRLTWGFAYGISWALYIAVATLAGLVVTKDKVIGDSFSRYRMALLYLAWTAVTTVFALAPDSATGRLIEFTKIQLMCFVMLCMLTTRKRIEWFVVVITMSVAFFGIKGGIFTLLTGGANRVYGPEMSVLGDNNQLATALVMTIPMLFWMAEFVERRWMKYAIYGAMALTAVSIFGSHSRGALLAIAAMAAFLVAKSRHKAPAVMLALVGAVVAVTFMPDDYWERMQTITTYDEDASAQGRLRMWRAAIDVASDRITGGGFNVYDAPAFAAYVTGRVLAAHSIYFQALGEHGWPGIALFLTFWISIWLQSRHALRELESVPDSSKLSTLVRMTQVSLIGYAVGGAFVNIGYWDFPFYLSLIVMGLRRIAREAAVDTVAARSGSLGRPAATSPQGLRPVRPAD